MDYYYQIKGKSSDNQSEFGVWIFPPIFSGKVTAKDKKEARELICEEYGKKFPIRVLHKDLESNDFLLSIKEMEPGSHYHKLFELQKCEQCDNTFYVIDKYNDKNCRDKGFAFCSDTCRDDNGKMHQMQKLDNELLIGSAVPVIYKITNKVSGMVYIGKTSQVFTLRWYQHFFQFGSNKFHDAIKKSKFTDWQFEIIEIIEFPQEIKENKDFTNYINNREKYIIERERYWINHHDSIVNGYNSI